MSGATRQLAHERLWSDRRFHFLGIGGAGMSGLALIAHSLGAEISGCDRVDSPYTEMLRAHGIEPLIGHSPDHIRDGLELVVSTAIPEDSAELVTARERGLRVHQRGALLADVAALRRTIAVAGTHGKTTTAAMIAHCLRAAGYEPGYSIGAERRDGPNASIGAGEWFVAEADESDRTFLELAPEIAVVTNVELDHHSTYRSVLELRQAFDAFLARVSPGGALVVWREAASGVEMPSGVEVVTFALEGRASITAADVHEQGLATRFRLLRAAEAVCEVTLPVPGRHNVLDALAALAACERAGCDLARTAGALASFESAGRRFELRADASGIRIFDDYAHHPTEVRATLEVARVLRPTRLIAVFQPHLYSRTSRLARELGRALTLADEVVVLDVYGARERPEGEFESITGKLVADATAERAGGRPVWWLPTLDEAGAMLERSMRAGDLIVTLGAGDVDKVASRLARVLAARKAA